MINEIEKNLLAITSDMHSLPEGAYSIRKNAKLESRNSTENIVISTNKNSDGIYVVVKPNTINQSLHIPVIISQSGIKENVENIFEIGDNSTVTIIAGCSIHSTATKTTEHNGNHKFIIGKNCNIKYIEKHYAEGVGNDKNINPMTDIIVGENSVFDMLTVQIGGVDNSIRKTVAKLDNGAKLIVNEKILTKNTECANTDFYVELNGENSSVDLVSRNVARDKSKQFFASKIVGNNKCFGHSECDGILVGDAVISAMPIVIANNSDASLVHEAAIGKIAGDQIIKLMTLGLTQSQAEEKIISGFLK